MARLNIEIPDHFDRFIQDRVASGQFSDASEVITEGLRMFEENEADEEAKIEWLRAAAEEGFADIERGDYVTLSSPEEIDAYCAEVLAEALAKSGASKSRG